MVKVLVIKPSSLGDIIHSAAAVEAIARSRPDCRVSWLVNEEYAEFVRELPGVFDVLPFPRGRFRRHGFPFWLPRAASWLWSLRGDFDVAVDLQGLQRSALMARVSGARERFGPRNARELAWMHYNRPVDVPAELRHAVDRVNHVAREVLARSECLVSDGVRAAAPRQDYRLPVPAAARSAAQARLGNSSGPLLALCPGARWSSKLWPEERWVELLRGLRERHGEIEPVFLGTPGEAAAIDEILRRSAVPGRSLAGRIDLWQTAAVLESAAAAVTLDSAPLHLAAAVGTPTVALFGPTDPRRVAPRSPEHTVLRPDLDCLGGYERHCPLERRVCVPDVEAADVLEALERVLP